MDLSSTVVSLVVVAATTSMCQGQPVVVTTDPGTYSHAQFGSDWYDFNKDGCDTREDILERDADAPADTDGDGCNDDRPVIDRYTRIPQPVSVIDIDEVVSRHEAWVSGASGWTREERIRFGNDPANLVATHRSINRSKGEQDPDEWEAIRTYGVDVRCEYAQTYRTVKIDYKLVITPSQDKALRELCDVR
jgi:hypothetical protein